MKIYSAVGIGIVLSLVVACSGPTFTHIGNGVGIPTESIRQRARSENISFQQASELIRNEMTPGDSDVSVSQ